MFKDIVDLVDIWFILFFSLGIPLLALYISLKTKEERVKALDSARRFVKLDVNNNIWENITLSNEHCCIKLLASFSGSNDNIVVEDKCINNSYRSLYYVGIIRPFDKMWNYICLSFNADTEYETVKNLFKLHNHKIIEKIFPTDKKETTENFETTDFISNFKIDVNNCREEELIALPGINTILAKKIVKRREELDGFKDLKEFFKYINLSNHAKKQLINKICFNKKKIAPYQQLFDERNLDF